MMALEKQHKKSTREKKEMQKAELNVQNISTTLTLARDFRAQYTIKLLITL